MILENLINRLSELEKNKGNKEVLIKYNNESYGISSVNITEKGRNTTIEVICEEAKYEVKPLHIGEVLAITASLSRRSSVKFSSMFSSRYFNSNTVGDLDITVKEIVY